MATASPKGSWFTRLARERSVQIAVGIWIACSALVFPLSQGALPFHRPLMAGIPFRGQVLAPSIVLGFILLEMSVVYFLTRKRTIPDLGSRAPNAVMALRETMMLWLYGAVVMGVGHVVGVKWFGEGIGLHLNGSLFGATRMQSPREVWTWASYNFVLLAVVPYIVFRARGYSPEALNLKSNNLRNDALVVLVILAIGTAVDLPAGGLLKFSGHQILTGTGVSFLVHLLGTGLPVMIFIYAILLPRYMRMTRSVAATTLLGGLSYGAIHVLEYWTVYDSAAHSLLSVIFALLTFVPPGLMKSYLTLRTGNAWVHLWAYHAIDPHVTADTPLIIHDFGIE
jgi:hypothetical protein